jgi:cell division septal protein FtsQ
MAKRSKKKNINMVKYGRFLIIGIFVLFVSFFMYNKGGYLIRHSALFKVKDIVRDPSLQFVQSRHLLKLVGRNIFDVDLENIQKQLKKQYPQIDNLKILRKFPNRIYITAEKRTPFAVVIAENNNIIIDDRGVVISAGRAAHSQLPNITGIMSADGVSVGNSLRSRGVRIAVNIIKVLKRSEYFSSTRVESIDIGNLSKINFSFVSGLDIIIDQYKIEQKINKLGVLMSEGNLNKKEISYIDLRFKEPVLGKK